MNRKPVIFLIALALAWFTYQQSSFAALRRGSHAIAVLGSTSSQGGSSTPTGDSLLLESGDDLLLESGDKTLLN